MAPKISNHQANSEKNHEALLRNIECLAKNAPKEGLIRAIKKRYFRPKTNWAMLAVLIALATLVISALKYL